MRGDMKEVLITDGRHGSAYRKNEQIKKLRRQKIEEDDVGGSMQMLPKTQNSWGERKTDAKGEHLAPLKRYLRSKVGCPWDDVYSEIKQNNPSNSSVGAHIYEHLKGYVYQYHDIEIKDGAPGYYGRYSSTWSPLRPGAFYIDAEGILRVTPDKVNTPRREPGYKQIDKYTYLVKNLNGIWFEWKLSDRYLTYTYYVDVCLRDEAGRIVYDSNNSPTYVKKLKVAQREIDPLASYTLDDYCRSRKRYPTDIPDRDYSTVPGIPTGMYVTSVRTLSRKDKKKYGLK